MSRKRCFIASLVVFIAIAALEYVFNNHCLASLYQATANVWRPAAEMNRMLPYGMAIYLVVAFIFTYIYSMGYQAKPSRLGEGLRYGFIMGLFASLPMAGWSYITLPIPPILSIYWFAMGMVEFLIAGAIVGLIYKRE